MSEAFLEAARKNEARLRGAARSDEYYEIEGDLANLNRAGFITVDYQDAFDSKQEKKIPHQRAYVCGFMPADRARRFVDYFNIWYDKISVLIKVGDSTSIPIGVSSRLVRGNIWEPDRHVYLCRSREAIMEAKRKLEIPETEDVEMVCVLDAHWGNFPYECSDIFDDTMDALDNVQ